MYHLTKTKNGVSATELMRRLGVSYNTVWMLKQKLMQVMLEREARTTLTDRVEIDDTYTGGERMGGKVGRGAPTKYLLSRQYKPTDKASHNAWLYTRLAVSLMSRSKPSQRGSSSQQLTCIPMDGPPLRPSSIKGAVTLSWSAAVGESRWRIRASSG